MKINKTSQQPVYTLLLMMPMWMMMARRLKCETVPTFKFDENSGTKSKKAQNYNKE